MLARQRAALAAAFSCFAMTAAAQGGPNRFDVTNCYAGTISAIARAQAYNVVSLDFRGTVRAAEQGGPLDRHVSHCKAAGGTIGDNLYRLNGFCEFSASPEDRVLSRWTFEGGRGSGRLVAGTGRYRGISGEYSFQPAGGPFPASEPGVLQGCTRLTGEYRLP